MHEPNSFDSGAKLFGKYEKVIQKYNAKYAKGKTEASKKD